MNLYLLVFTGAMKNLFHPAWVFEHLIFFGLGCVFVFGRERMALHRWSLVLVPILYLIGELAIWLGTAGIIFTGGAIVLNFYDIIRYLLFFSLGEGAGLLIQLLKPLVKKDG